MKRLLSILCIVILVVLQAFMPLISYAQENDKDINNVEDNTVQEQIEETVTNEKENETEEVNEIQNNVIKEENSAEENIEKLNVEENKIQSRISMTGSETIVDGTTNRITTKLSGRAVGTDGGSEENGADINLWDDISVSQQRFKFEYYEEGYYKIINEKSVKLLDVVGSGLESGTPVDQWEDNGGYDNQKWIVKDAGNGYYYIVSSYNGLYLDVYAGLADNGTNVQVYEANGSNAQRFTFEDLCYNGIDVSEFNGDIDWNLVLNRQFDNRPKIPFIFFGEFPCAGLGIRIRTRNLLYGVVTVIAFITVAVIGRIAGVIPCVSL